VEQRILICSGAEDGAGVRRCVALAEGIARLMPDAITLLVTSGDTEWMELPERLVVVGLPRGGRSRRPEGAARRTALRGHLLGDFVSEFQPDVVVVDGEAAQPLRQLEPALRRLGAEARRPALMLAARDVDLPRLLRRARRGHGSSPLERCDMALVYGREAASDAVLGESLADCPTRLGHVGYLAPRPRAEGIAAATAAFGADGPFALCPVSSVNAVPLARAFLEDLAGRASPVQPVVLVSPALGAELRGALRRSAPPGSIVRERRPALEGAIAAAAAVVATLTDDCVPEALALGRPLVALQEAGAVAEQRIRGEALDGVSHVRILPRTTLRAGALHRAGTLREVVRSLVSAPAPPAPWPAEGADRAAALLAAALPRLPWAAGHDPPTLQLPASP
jgi:predicted glycosyltransferase